LFGEILAVTFLEAIDVPIAAVRRQDARSEAHDIVHVSIVTVLHAGPDVAVATCCHLAASAGVCVVVVVVTFLSLLNDAVAANR
jgi:hypothetical protein